MKGIEIKQRIDRLNKQIEDCLSPNIFTLNNVIVEITREIDELQKQCPHEYDEEGYCIYCNKMREENDG